jgi:hypothetical protein
MNKSEVFNLYLSSNTNCPFLIDGTDKNNCLYRVEFDSLFQGKAKKYNYCELRVLFNSLRNSSSTSAIASTTGNLVLRGGLSELNNYGTTGVYLCEAVPQVGVFNTTTPSTVDGWYYYTNNLGNISGTPIVVPEGSQQFRIQLVGIASQNLLTTLAVNYDIILQFELSNR